MRHKYMNKRELAERRRKWQVACKPKIAILMITHNRFQYTRKAIFYLLQYTRSVPFDLIIVDNASTDNTRRFLQTIDDARVRDVILNDTNRSLSSVTNMFWHRCVDEKYDLVGKVDNDTIVSRRWLPRLLELHNASDRVGAVGGFAFDLYEDWNFEHSKRNVRLIGKRRILVQPYIGGCSYLVKTRVIRHVGFLNDDIALERNGKKIPGIVYGWTEWQEKAARLGYIHGYPFPLESVEHMDDPLSIHCLLDKDPVATEIARRNAEQRGLEYSREIISEWIRANARTLFTRYVYKGDVGQKVYK